jgi:CRISPR type III-B/RAMP module-associated protein Cmr5
MAQTLDQKRAKHAWELVTKAKALPGDKRKELGVELKKMPTRIIASGLGQSLAYLEAKKKAPSIVEGLSDWIAVMRPPSGGGKSLKLRIINGDSDFLRWATAESLAYLQWFVRLAEAEGIKDEDAS